MVPIRLAKRTWPGVLTRLPLEAWVSTIAMDDNAAGLGPILFAAFAAFAFLSRHTGPRAAARDPVTSLFGGPAHRNPRRSGENLTRLERSSADPHPGTSNQLPSGAAS